jgi:hypothetical protein
VQQSARVPVCCAQPHAVLLDAINRPGKQRLPRIGNGARAPMRGKTVGCIVGQAASSRAASWHAASSRAASLHALGWMSVQRDRAMLAVSQRSIRRECA